MMKDHILKFTCKHCDHTFTCEHGKDAFISTESCDKCGSLAFGLVRREIVPRPKVQVGMAVRVYWNFHKKLFSVQVRSLNTKGKMTWQVAGHFDYLELEDVTFNVSQSGRQHVLREQKKNVHAKIHGKVLAFDGPSRVRKQWYDYASYNPYKNEMFIRTNVEGQEQGNIVCCCYLGLMVVDGKHPKLQLFYSSELDEKN